VLESYYQQYQDQGLVIITLMPTNESQGPSTPESAAAWKSGMNLSYPVVAVDMGITGIFNPFLGYPSYKIMSPGMVVSADDPWPLQESDIQNALP
jgi:hypothetical protein